MMKVSLLCENQHQFWNPAMRGQKNKNTVVPESDKKPYTEQQVYHWFSVLHGWCYGTFCSITITSPCTLGVMENHWKWVELSRYKWEKATEELKFHGRPNALMYSVKSQNFHAGDKNLTNTEILGLIMTPRKKIDIDTSAVVLDFKLPSLHLWCIIWGMYRRAFWAMGFVAQTAQQTVITLWDLLLV